MSKEELAELTDYGRLAREVYFGWKNDKLDRHLIWFISEALKSHAEAARQGALREVLALAMSVANEGEHISVITDYLEIAIEQLAGGTK